MTQTLTVSSEEMREMDRRATEQFGIPSLLLMENAGRSIAELIINEKRNKRVLVCVGKGNNGGDGLVIARHLFLRDYDVRILIMENPDTYQGDAKTNLEIVQKLHIPHTFYIENTPQDFRSIMQQTDMIVDALFGIGLHSPLTGKYLLAVNAINEFSKYTVCVDVPTGINADTGEVMGGIVKADITATLGFPKKGLYLDEGQDYVGKIVVVDIGLPKYEAV